MRKSRYQVAACFLFCLLLMAGIQRWSGAAQAAFNGYPDEPSHYLSGLMVHDYIHAGFPMNPRSYAIEYYLHLPFFAVGYWPPFFYLVEGLWMSVAGHSRPEVLLLMALIAALISTTIFAVVRPVAGAISAFCCAILFLLLPDVISNSSMVMTDTIVALLSFWCMLTLARYFEKGALRDSILFAFLASCTILAKYSGFYVALIPVVALLLGRRWDLLRRFSFWLQPVLVLLFCAPWILYTHRYAATGLPGFALPTFLDSLPLILRTWTTSLGWLSVLLFAGWIYQTIYLTKADSLRQVMWIQPLALVIFLAGAPVFTEPRYLICGLPPLIVLLAFALARLPKWYGPATLAAVTAVCSIVSVTHLPHVTNTIRPVVEAIQRSGGIRQSLVYVPCDEEGPVIAEFAMLDGQRPERVLARPNKMFAKMDWFSYRYKSDYHRPDDLERYFEQNPPDLLILHTRSAAQQYPHERLLETAIHHNPAAWKLLATATGHEIYQFTGQCKVSHKGITPLFRSRINARFEVE